MFGGPNRLLVAAIVAGGLLAAPSAAIAGCGGGPSAQNVYSECVPTGGGGKSTGKSTGGTPTGGAQTSGSTSGSLSGPTAVALAHAGKDRRVLSSLIRGYGLHRLLGTSAASGADTAPTALGSAVDVGSGPTALLIVLAGTAILLLSGSGYRVWRSRHRQ